MSNLNEPNELNKEKNKFKTLRLGLTAEICLMIIGISILIGLPVSIINYNKYRSGVYELHQSYTERFCKTIESSLTTEEWQALAEATDDFQNNRISAKKMKEFVSTGDYKTAMDNIQNFVDRMELTQVSVFTVDREEMDAVTEDNFDPDESAPTCFLMDFYPNGSGVESVESGYAATWWSDYEIFDSYRALLESVLDNKKEMVIREGVDSGDMFFTEYYPIMNGKNVVAIMQVCSNDFEISSFMQMFLHDTLWKSVLVALICILLAIAFSYYNLIRPLRTISQEAEKFVENNAELSEQLQMIRTHDEIEELSKSILHMEKEVQNYIGKVAEMTEENARIGTELQVATKIQEGMLPTVFPAFPDRKDFQVYATMDPAKEVGGDFYDFFLLDENHLVLLIADVSGKGVPAALFMAIAKSLIKSRAQLGGTLSEILYDVNNQLCEGNEEEFFVTVWMAMIDLTTGEGTTVNAGHEHPARTSGGKSFELVCYRHSMAMAVMEGISFKEHSFKLQPGDRIFVYTDGLPEAINTAEEAYGTDRFLHILNENEDASFEEILRLIAEDVEKFKGEEPQFDDLTMLMFEYKGKE